MDNSSFSIGLIQHVHFISVFTYINTLSDIFYSLEKIRDEERFQPFPVVNALFEHFNGSNYGVEAKKDLARRLLRNSDLYEGRENEILDMRYINATFDHIISNIVFSKYGNVHGYLAKILSRKKNLQFSSLRQVVFQDLLNLEYMNEDGSFSYLSFMAIVGILDTLILPLFPEPEEDMRLIDVDYIYAQAGWMLVRSTMTNSTNFTFEDYISMSQTIELAASQNKSYGEALQIFTLPALLFYVHQENDCFKKQTVAHLMKKQDFWIQALQNMFSHLKETFDTISKEELEKSPTYQFALAIKDFKNRTSIAREILEEHCPGIPEDKFKSEIEDYKILASSYSCFTAAVWGTSVGVGVFHPKKLLPNINEIYSAQFDKIEQNYHSYAKMLIREAFQEGNLMKIINSLDTTVFHDQILPETEPYGYGSILKEPVLEPNEHLFTVDNHGSRSFLVMIHDQHNITLLRYNSLENFLRAFGLSMEKTKIQESSLKSPTESFEDFENKIADWLAKDFRKALYALGYDKTTGEKVLDFGLTLVPFYDCIRNVREGNSAGAILACTGDIAMLVPFGAQLASVGSKLSTLAARSLVTATGVSVRTLTLRHAIRLAMEVGSRQVLARSVRIVQKEILTKQMFKDLSLGLVRSLDPGFELMGKSFWKGSSKLVDLFQQIWQNAEKSSSMSSRLSSVKKSWILLENRLKSAKHGKFVSSSHIRCKRTPPAPGVNPLPGACSSKVNIEIYIPELVPVPGGMAELRQTINPGSKIPVVVSRISRLGKVYYKQVNLQTGHAFGPEMKFNNQGLLEPVVVSLPKSIGDTGLLVFRRGRFMLERELNIVEATEFLSESKLQIPVEKAREIMKHYILAIEPVLAFHSDLSVPQLDESLGLDIDVENPNVLRKYLDSDKKDPSRMEISVNQYTGVGVPTYQDFALDLVTNNGFISDVYQPWFVSDPGRLNELLYLSQFEDMRMERIQEGHQRIVKLYGPYYQQQMNANLENVIREYVWNEAWNEVNFEDFFAIHNFVKNGYVKIKQNVHANRLLYIALFRLALRQGTNKSVIFPRHLWMIQSESSLMYSHAKSMETTKEFVTLKHFQVASLMEPYGISTARKIALEHPNVKLASFKITLNSGYSTADISRIIDSEQKHVIIPGTKFRLELSRKSEFKKSSVLYMKMHHVPIQEEICFRDIARNLEILQESQIQ